MYSSKLGLDFLSKKHTEVLAKINRALPFSRAWYSHVHRPFCTDSSDPSLYLFNDSSCPFVVLVLGCAKVILDISLLKYLILLPFMKRMVNVYTNILFRKTKKKTDSKTSSITSSKLSILWLTTYLLCVVDVFVNR